MTGRLTAKLDSLSKTVALLEGFDLSGLAEAVSSSANRCALAVGSGGSVVSAEYFSRCRETLRYAPTFVQTPMELVLGNSNISQSDVWFFSASGSNEDICAAVEAAAYRNAHAIHLVTRSEQSRAASTVSAMGGVVHIPPVSDSRDSFLATHSLLSTVAALLVASARISEPGSEANILTKFIGEVQKETATEARQVSAELCQQITREDQLILLSDPQLKAVSRLIDTSLWEASLLPVQTTDFRNFAHGRHTWLHHYRSNSVLIAFTGNDSKRAWNAIDALKPKNLRTLEVGFGDCGRFSNAIGVVRGLVLIEALGNILGRDPGKPGTADFARKIFDDTSLGDLVRPFGPAIYQKRSALQREDCGTSQRELQTTFEGVVLRRMANVEFGGIVLDYDGTAVATDERYDPPRREILCELTRLQSEGLKLGIATGRGGSAGNDLRAALDVQMHKSVLVGYYNGGYVQSLDIDIKLARPLMNSSIAEVAEFLRSCENVISASQYKVRGVQITINPKDLATLEQIEEVLEECTPVADGRIKTVRSAHSLDLIPSSVSKLDVVMSLKKKLREDQMILCLGDSGSRTGNDHELLSNPYGISVGTVSGCLDECWSFFGEMVSGPDALVRILRALKPQSSGSHSLDVEELDLDKLVKVRT